MWFHGLELAFRDIQLIEELPYQVLRLEYILNCTFRCIVITLDCFHEMDVAQHMFMFFIDQIGIYGSLV